MGGVVERHVGRYGVVSRVTTLTCDELTSEVGLGDAHESGVIVFEVIVYAYRPTCGHQRREAVSTARSDHGSDVTYTGHGTHDGTSHFGTRSWQCLVALAGRLAGPRSPARSRERLRLALAS